MMELELRPAVLPLTHCLNGDVQLVCQVLLGQAQLIPALPDLLSLYHGAGTLPTTS